MSECRVVILSRPSLLVEGVESLLSKEEGVNVARVDAREPQVPDLVRQMRPDVILCLAKQGCGEAGWSPWSLVEAQPRASLFCLDSYKEELRVYRMDRFTTKGYQDFLRLLTGGASGAS